jgi:hypothetical protein
VPKDNFTIVVSIHLATIGVADFEEGQGLAQVLEAGGYCVSFTDNRIPDDNPNK